MAIPLSSLEQSARPKPPRLLIYGVPKIGKTTMLASAPKPVVIQTEDGADEMDVPRFPLAKSFSDVMGALETLATEDHDFQTVGIDSLDWLEPLIWQHVCQRNNWKSIEDPGYGKGFSEALDVWREYIDAINYLRDEKGMAIIQVAHSNIKRFDGPETDSYDRYEIKLHKGAAALVQEHSDAVLFVNYQVHVTKQDVGFKKEIAKAIGQGGRVVHTEQRPAFLAGNRYGMPAEIPFPKNEPYWQIAQHIPFYAAMIGDNTASDDNPTTTEAK